MAMKRWKGTEQKVCTLLGKRHIGGPGHPIAEVVVKLSR